MKKGIIATILLTVGLAIPIIASARVDNVSQTIWDNTDGKHGESFWFNEDCDEKKIEKVYSGEYKIYVDEFKNNSNSSVYVLETKVFTRGNHLLYNNSTFNGNRGFIILNSPLLSSIFGKVGGGETIRHMTTAEEINGAQFEENRSFDKPVQLGNRTFRVPNYRSDGTHPNSPTNPSMDIEGGYDAEFRTITLYSNDDKFSTYGDNKAIVECQKNVIRRCGDGILDTEYGETCDPKAQPWISNNACDPDTCKGKTPVCRSSLNGETVQSLDESSYLCEVGTMTDFHYNESTRTWTWKCDNVAGNSVNCSAKKASDGILKIEKTLKDKKRVENTGQILMWEVKVWAESGDVTDFQIKDIVPFALQYVDYSVGNNQDNLTVKNPTGPKKTATGNVYTWDVEGTLKQGHELILKVMTQVIKMPTSEDDYRNVACVVKNGKEDCDEDQPEMGILKIEKTLKDKKRVEKTGQILTWEVKVWAESGDVTDFEIWDKMPKKLTLIGATLTGNTQGIKLTKKDKTTESGDNIIYYWDAEGTLKGGKSITMVVTTKVNEMPEADEDILNVACVVKNNNDEPTCDDDKTGKPKLRIKKYILDGDNEVKKIEVKEGDTITYIIHFGNSGNVAATITSIKDFLPKNVQYKSGSIHINRSSTHGDGTQVGDTDLIKGFKVVDGVRIEIYGGMTLEPGDEGYIIITGEIKSEFTDNRTNFACIYLNDKLVDCDNASHDFSTPPPPPGPDPDSKNPYCDYAEWRGNNVFCKVGNARAKMQLTCIHNGKRTTLGDRPSGTVLEYEFKNVGSGCDDGRIQCEIWNGDWSTSKDCKLSTNESEETEQCFNVNAGNFSIHEGEIFPFYWNLRNMENWAEKNKNNYTTIDGDYRTAPEKYNNSGECESDQNGKIATDSMVCTFEIRGGNNTKLYTIEGPCLSSTSINPLESNKLLGAWYDAMLDTYCNNPKDCYFSFNPKRGSNSGLLPSAVYYIQNFGSGATVSLDGTKWEGDWDMAGNRDREANKPYGEYKIRLSGVKYLQCEDGEWKQVRNPEEFAPCESNFVLTNPYTVQKTPSGNLTASTKELEKYKYLSGSDVFSSLINAIETTNYKSNNQVENAMETFISKYSKLAVEVKVGNDSFLEGTKIKKVPGKNIYFVDGDLRIKGGQAIKTPFTIVQTNETKTVTIVGNVQHNMMLLTKGKIIFQGNNCTEDQTVKGIFYAKGNLNRLTQYRNNVTTSDVWCTGGGLHIKGVLIGNKFDNLMNNSRSHLNDWFNENDKKKSVMNGASVLIEYSPSIFSKSTMPPGAEDFTTALSIYKQ